MIPRRRGPRGAAFFITVAVACSVVAALVHVWVRLQVIQAGYDLARESRIHHDLLEQNQKLRLELATRKDPAVIERRAREELHMAPPDPTAIRVLTVGGAPPRAAAPSPPGPVVAARGGR